MSHWLLPGSLRERIRRHEQYKWQETRGVGEDNLIRNLPKDLRRDIKRHLCLALMMRVILSNSLFKTLVYWIYFTLALFFYFIFPKYLVSSRLKMCFHSKFWSFRCLCFDWWTNNHKSICREIYFCLMTENNATNGWVKWSMFDSLKIRFQVLVLCMKKHH